MMSILQEDEEGTLARIFSTPTGRTSILAGKFLAVVLMVTVQGVVMILAGIVLFKVNWGNPLACAPGAGRAGAGCDQPGRAADLIGQEPPARRARCWAAG